MDCPYCGKEMLMGKIPSGTTWVEDGGYPGKTVPLCGGLFAEVPKSFFCPDCRQIILPVPEVEGFLDQARRTMRTAEEKLGAAREQWEARRTEKQKETKRKKYEGKDPWEL